MAKNVCAICGKELGAFSSSCKLIDSHTIGLTPELQTALSPEVMCLPCYYLLERVQESDPQAVESWEDYMEDQPSESVRSYMEIVLDESAPALDEGEDVSQEDGEEIPSDTAEWSESDWTDATDDWPDVIRAIQMTSGFNFEGYTITNYLGFISEETAVGMGLFKGIASSFSDFFGSESDSLRRKLTQSKQIVIYRLCQDALEAGANAIIGIDLDYTMFGESIVGVIVSGTAVSIAPNDA